MVKNLSKVLDWFREAGLKLKPRKCHLFATEVEFLGHLVSAKGIRTDPKKPDSIRSWPTQLVLKKCDLFLGFAAITDASYINSPTLQNHCTH